MYEDLFNGNITKPKAPLPCFRAIYDHVVSGTRPKLKVDDNGILRCSGYIKAMNESPDDECNICPFYLDDYYGKFFRK